MQEQMEKNILTLIFQLEQRMLEYWYIDIFVEIQDEHLHYFLELEMI
jgi:hypothetical protein